MVITMGLFGFLDVFWIQNGNQIRCPAMFGLHVYIQFDPVETAMLRVRINSYDRSFKPALAFPESRIEKDFYAISDLDWLWHYVIRRAVKLA